MWSIFWEGSRFIRYANPVTATAIYLNHSIDLISKSKSNNGFSHFETQLQDEKLSDKSTKKVIHLYYEAGRLFNDLEFSDSEQVLAIIIEYSSKSTWIPSSDNLIDMNLKPLKGVSKKSYEEDFNKGVEHLYRGDCYQFNLSYEFEYSFNSKVSAEQILSKMWSNTETIAPYAHATYIENFDELILSNSPECLFQAEVYDNHSRVWTMPIKGTMPRTKNWRESFQKLLNSKKDRGELDMITDLLRNDLTRIENQFSKVVKRCAPLIVPKIIHQYSLITTKVSNEVTLYSLLKAMFPGGSITGAPKRRVIEILSNLEKRSRGIYCGSTILFNGDKCCASINIRTAQINLSSSRLVYSAGGGITLLSNCEDEFLEMHLKKDSFVRNL